MKIKIGESSNQRNKVNSRSQGGKQGSGAHPLPVSFGNTVCNNDKESFQLPGKLNKVHHIRDAE